MNKTIRKTEFIKIMRERCKERFPGEQISQSDFYYMLQVFNDCIGRILEDGDTIQLYKWWTIRPKLRKGHTVDGSIGKFEIPPMYFPSFRPGTQLKAHCKKFGERLAAGEFDEEEEVLEEEGFWYYDEE